MEKYEYRETVKKEKVVTEIKCDKCERSIVEDQTPVWETHFKVSTSHHRWGNDSIDSLEHYDFCDIACLTNHMNEYYSRGEDTDEYDISLNKYKF